MSVLLWLLVWFVVRLWKMPAETARKVREQRALAQLEKGLLALTDGDWKVYDVTINGVSLVITYRSSFNQEVQRNGLDGLIERIKERNRNEGAS